MGDRRYDHRQLGLRGVFAPFDAGQEREKAEAELEDQQSKNGDRGNAQRGNLGVADERGDGGPGEDERDDGCVQNVGSQFIP